MFRRNLVSIVVLFLLTGTAYSERIDINFADDFNRMAQQIRNMMGSQFGQSGLYALSGRYAPKVNLREQSDRYIVTFDIAGVAKKEIKLTLDHNNILTLEGERKTSKRTKNETMIRQEIFYGSFKRSISLPDNIQSDKLTTKYDNGILTVSILKKKIDKPITKIIKIN